MSEDYHNDSFSDIEEKYSETKRKKIELEQFQNQIIKKRVIINPKLKNEEEKRMLLELLKKEPIIWDKQHKLHSNCRALNLAWKRVADETPSMTVSDCKVIWKSLKDALRYRKRVTEKVVNDKSVDDPEDEENELEIMLSLLTPSAEPSLKAGSENAVSENIEEKEKKKKLPQVKKYQIIRENKILRRKLTAFIKKEDVIWNPQHKLHRNPSAIFAAWERIAEGMQPMSADECKEMWKNVRDSIRYSLRKKKQIAENEMLELKQESETQDLICYQKSSSTKPIEQVLIHDTIDNNETSNSISASNFSSVSEKEETNEVFESLGTISKAISELVSVAASIQPPSHAVNSFKYDYIWRLIENLYGQLDESTINDVNQQIINLVYENCKPERV